MLHARDKWLRKDGEGLMYPSCAYLYVCPVEMSSYLNESLGHWTDYHGLDFGPMANVYRELLLEKPVVETIGKEQLIDDEKILCTLDLKTVEARELETIQSYNLDFSANRDTPLHGIDIQISQNIT